MPDGNYSTVLINSYPGSRMMLMSHYHIYTTYIYFTLTAQGGPYAYNPHSDSQYLAEENEELTSHLRDKVRELKSVSRADT